MLLLFGHSVTYTWHNFRYTPITGSTYDRIMYLPSCTWFFFSQSFLERNECLNLSPAGPLGLLGPRSWNEEFWLQPKQKIIPEC